MTTNSSGGMTTDESSEEGPPERVAVAGTSGSGKSSLARRIATRLGLPYTEIDSLFHGPGWTERPEFAVDVARLVEQPAWVTEWQYPQARPRIAAQAQLLVWLDPPLGVVMWRVTIRTLRRRLRHEVLWNGNVEPPLWTVFADRDHIVRWAWRNHPSTARLVQLAAAEHPDLAVVRLRRASEVTEWLEALPAVAAAGDTAGQVEAEEA